MWAYDLYMQKKIGEWSRDIDQKISRGIWSGKIKIASTPTGCENVFLKMLNDCKKEEMIMEKECIIIRDVPYYVALSEAERAIYAGYSIESMTDYARDKWTLILSRPVKRSLWQRIKRIFKRKSKVKRLANPSFGWE